MWSLKPILFQLFGIYPKQADTFKDGNDKGIWERYQESLAEEFDTNMLPLIENLVVNTTDPENFLIKFIEHYEFSIGSPVTIDYSEDLRRKMINFNNNITMIRGTQLSYDILYNILGLTSVTINVFNATGNFDSGVTLDEDQRTFDNDQCCRIYTLTLVGPASIDSVLEAAINRINNYLRPINGLISEILYNGTPITITP